jgi:hypothetical protein
MLRGNAAEIWVGYFKVLDFGKQFVGLGDIDFWVLSSLRKLKHGR